MSKLRAIILDAGGVLVWPICGDWTIPAAYKEILKERADSVHSPAWREALKTAGIHLREDVLISSMDEEYEKRLSFLREMDAQLHWSLTEAELCSLAEDYTRNPARYGWYADVEPWLSAWHGRIKLGMLSDAMPSFGEFTRLQGADRYFDAILLSTQLGACKPDARMYLEICRRLNVAPEECLFVDDRENNLRGAMDVGMSAVQMCRDGLAPWDGAFVRSLAELNAHIEAMSL